MSLVTVYRVEALEGPRAGQGPYQAAPSYDTEVADIRYEALFERADSYAETHPDPCSDPGLEYIKSGVEFCGFTSKRALRQWFRRGALRLLCETGYYGLVAYEVPREHVRRGTRQVVFVMEQARDRRILDHRTA